MKYQIIGNVYRDGVHLSSFDVADGAAHVITDRDASHLCSSYVCGLVIQGGTATYSRPHDEYKIVMPDGATEYVRWPVRVADGVRV